MRARFVPLLCGLVIVVGAGAPSKAMEFGGASRSVAGKWPVLALRVPAPKNGELPPTITGKWAPVGESAAIFPEGSFIEFTSDGAISLTLSLNGKPQMIFVGTYKIEGNKIHLSAKKGGKEDNETNTIKLLTADEMVLVDPKGKEEKFKRLKDK